MLPKPEKDERGKFIAFKHLPRKGDKLLGWFPRPGPELGNDPFGRAIHWVKVMIPEVCANALLLNSLAPETREARRVRGVLAADRALLEFWLSRARRIARVLGHRVGESWEAELTQLQAVDAAIGPPLDVDIIASLERAHAAWARKQVGVSNEDLASE